MSEPDNTAVRVALWRALHVLVDAAPHVLEDELGLKLAAPDADWRERGDMHARRLARTRASIVARARFIEDLVEQSTDIEQYVLLGAGLDTFAQRRPELASRLHVFEVDRAGTQAWKRERLGALGFGIPDWLKFVPVDFETDDWLVELQRAGFEATAPAVVTSTGVSMYLTREAVAATLKKVAGLAPGSRLAMSFVIPIDQVEAEERPGMEGAARGARAAGTPFVSFFMPPEMLALARDAGFKHVEHVSPAQLEARYFAGRTDGLRPSSGEHILVATV